jgi:sulfatase maturation enzyme AslB (radical SAM superfamily)
MEKNFICKFPWAGFSNNPDGTVKPCCIYKENIKKNDGTDFYVQKDDVKEIFHSDYMNRLRSDFTQGKKPKACETCWVDESNNYKSKRLIYNDIFSDGHLKIDTENLNDYPIDYQIIISNSCNLKCRSCGTSHSTQWYKEINNLPENTIGKNDYVHKYNLVHGQSGRYDGIFIKNLSQWGSKVKRLEIVGGEPFYIDKWKTVWEFLIENNYSENIDLAMSTNATIFNEELLKKICNNFKTVGIGLSIDGMNETYEYLRKNASWDNVSENIFKFYDFYKNTNTNTLSFNYTFTISWVNAMILPEFNDWVNEKTPEFKIWHNIVHYPPHMSIKMLPDKEKKLIEDKWLRYDWGKYKNEIDSVLNFMWSETQSDEKLIREYQNFKFFDHIRNENTFEVIKQFYPELNRLLK